MPGPRKPLELRGASSRRGPKLLLDHFDNRRVFRSTITRRSLTTA